MLAKIYSPMKFSILYILKIHTRLSHLKQWTRVVLRRIESLLRISRWEQQVIRVHILFSWNMGITLRMEL